MDSFLKTLLLDEHIPIDSRGIVQGETRFTDEIRTSQIAWENIYNFTLEQLKEDRDFFDITKLEDTAKYINKYYRFNKDSVYLEIGCGPAHIAEYIMKTYDSYFIGIDFNYQILLTLKQYFDEKGYFKYLLIHGDVNTINLKDNTIDFIYGGGVIEHFPDTRHILKESYRVLKENGICLNTVPAFNLWWLIRFYNNIPAVPLVRQCFEFIHTTVFKNIILQKNYGYELSYTKTYLINLHKQAGFRSIFVEPFAFHFSPNKIKNVFLRKLFFRMQHNYLTAAVYVACGCK